MKSKKEIEQEIEAVQRSIKNYKDAYFKKEIPKDVFINQLIDFNATIDALKWVLGQNDRYD